MAHEGEEGEAVELGEHEVEDDEGWAAGEQAVPCGAAV